MPGKPSYKTAYIFIFHLNRHQILHETTKTYRTADNPLYFLSGFFLQTINFLEVKTDAVSSATNRIMKAEAMIVFYRNSSFRPQQITMKSFLSMKKKRFIPFW